MPNSIVAYPEFSAAGVDQDVPKRAAVCTVDQSRALRRRSLATSVSRA